MVALTKNIASIELAPARINGLSQLGIPTEDGTEAKRGKLQEFLQTLETSAIARRYQNIRVIAVKAPEAGQTVARLIVQFEVFGDDWRSVGDNTGVSYVLYKGDEPLTELAHGPLFLPFCRHWYEDQYEHAIPIETFDALTRIEFVALADEMQPG